MALVTITRLKPNQLQKLQLLVSNNDALLTDIIKGLQATYENNLNTNCPTCNQDGFIISNSIKIPCPTCKGYLLYHTAQGVITPPTNPFNVPVSISRLLPADIKEALTGFPQSTTLSYMITSLQSNFTEVPTNNCPVCTHTGWIGTVTCYLCSGIQKTVILYQIVNGIPVKVIPNNPPPNPRINPPDTNI